MKAGNQSIFAIVADDLNTITNEPEQLLRAQPKRCENAQNLIQKTYKIVVDADEPLKQSADTLPEVIVEDLDDEQIWQQLELRNNSVLSRFLEETSKLLAVKEQKLEIRLNEDDEEGESVEDEREQKEDDDYDNDDNNDNDKAEQSFNEDEEIDEDIDEGELTLTQHNSIKKGKKKFRTSIVDDKFFKLGEMEAFLEAEDAKDSRRKHGKPLEEDDDGIDYFAEDLGEGDDSGESDKEEEEANFKYKDFFADDVDERRKINVKDYADDGDGVGRKKKKYKDHFADGVENAENNENESDEDNVNSENGVEEEQDLKDYDNHNDDYDEHDDENDERDLKDYDNHDDDYDENDDENDDGDERNRDLQKSTFELRQDRLHQRIQDYEEERLGEKPWQLKGEIQATNRPQNSLLEEILEFDSTTRPAPVITAETTRCLEDIIRQRIKDQAWDDVEVKVRAVRTPQDYRKQLVLDQEKSKQSLAQIYEKEYQREIDKLNPNRYDDKLKEEPKEHHEIRTLMQKLFVKLDALSNFHFTPKPIAPEPKIITNTAAITMEEVAPVVVSDGTLLAPEEVFRGPKHELLGKTERDRTDKNRERRKKKSKQRAVHKALEAKDLARQKLGIPLTNKEEKAKLLKNITKHRNVEKMTDSNEQGSFKSSKAFFSKLQDSKSATSALKETATKRKLKTKELTAKKVKL